MVEQLFKPSYDNLESQVIYHLADVNTSFYEKIYTYLKNNTLPPDLSYNQKWNFIFQTTQHTLIADVLYWWGPDETLVQCLEHAEFEMTLLELHEGVCGTHLSGLTLAKKLLRLGYYWPTMERDSF